MSTDLVHWRELDTAIAPDEYGFIWSGSAVVDTDNGAGFADGGGEQALVAVYTTGGFGAPRPDQPGATPCVQAIACSTDRGRTFRRYAGNPVLGHVRANNRDPKVIRHAPTGQWIMALFLDGNDFALYASPDLKRWRHLCDLEVADTGECPDLFELPVDGDPGDTRWVFWARRASTAWAASTAPSSPPRPRRCAASWVPTVTPPRPGATCRPRMAAASRSRGCAEGTFRRCRSTARCRSRSS